MEGEREKEVAIARARRKANLAFINETNEMKAKQTASLSSYIALS